MPDPRPPHVPDPEAGERREALLTFVPAVLAAVALERGLVLLGGWPRGRAIALGIAVGIVVALVLQRVVARGRRG